MTIATKQGIDTSTTLTWCEPMERAKMGLTKGDIARALAWFKEKTGQEARTITLHPKNERFAAEAPEGVTVKYLGGCLAWEIWFTTGNGIGQEVAQNSVLSRRKARGVAKHLSVNMSILKEKKISLDKLKPATPKVAREKPGPKQRDLPVALIRRWHSQGMGSSAIATRLRKEKGITVSYKTVQRLLTGERPLL